MYKEANVILSFNILIMLCVSLLFKVVSHKSYRMIPLLVITRLVYMLLILLYVEVRL